MRLAQIIGAIAAASLVVTIDRNQGARSYPYQENKTAPNDSGPIIDSTPQSKRARRRSKNKEWREKNG